MLSLPTLLKAQTNTGTIQGQITNEQGEPLVGITVFFQELKKGTASDSAGVFHFNDIPKATYTIRFTGIGFETYEATIEVDSDRITKLDITLSENISEMEEITVKAESEGAVIEKSAQAVEVVELSRENVKTSDMGDILSRTQGVSVRRSGGLGSDTRFSMNGLTGDQIRFFLDGVPLQFTGYSFGISNIPTNLIDRVDIYKGVVPIDLGADALGGAVNLVSPKMSRGFSGSVSNQTGSFGTNRLAANGNFLDNNTGLFVSGGGFFDYTKNNYKVDVDVADERGRLRKVTVPRFHDSYRAFGVNLTIGVKDKNWADELSIKGFYSDFDKDIQHNQIMAGIPFGDVKTKNSSGGVNLKYRKNFSNEFNVDLVAGYNNTERVFVDTSRYAYNWFGERILKKNTPGEITAGGSHQFTWDDNFFARLNAAWNIAENHVLRVSLAPTYSERTGNERLSGSFDPLNATGRLFNSVNGLEYTFDSSDEKLQNRFFVKHYIQNLENERKVPGNAGSILVDRNETFFGAGNGLRYEFSPRLSSKLTYEYAIRMPRQDEVFGDGQFVQKNLELEPERSHNVNLEFRYGNRSDAKSNWNVQSNFFLRKIQDLILLIPAPDRTSINQNVFEANSMGMELAGGWNSNNNRFGTTFNTTYQDFYNSSDEGAFEAFRGDRIPNTPYFFANGSTRYSFPGLFNNSDKLTFFWSGRYVHQFFLSWESAGIKEFKLEIPSQFINSAGFTYELPFKNIRTSLTGEVQNLTNAKAFDFLSVQKPGRAFYSKLTVNF